MTAKTSRIIIKTFVKTALKDADEAPERCTRNLVDMALHFSKGRFQISFFEMALIEDALKHMDKDKLIEFGLNLGYNGCTMGAHIVRKIKRTENINVPWLLFLNIDSAHENLTESYQPIFDQGKDCITEDFADSAKDINHLLIGVNYDDHTDAACLVLRDHRLLYSVYRMFTEDESSEILSGSYYRYAEELHCPFSANVYKAAVGTRVAQKYRTIPIDLMYDAETVGNIISPPSSVIGFQPDGTIYNLRNNGKLLSHNIFKESLRDILQKSFSMGE